MTWVRSLGKAGQERFTGVWTRYRFDLASVHHGRPGRKRPRTRRPVPRRARPARTWRAPRLSPRSIDATTSPRNPAHPPSSHEFIDAQWWTASLSFTFRRRWWITTRAACRARRVRRHRRAAADRARHESGRPVAGARVAAAPLSRPRCPLRGGRDLHHRSVEQHGFLVLRHGAESAL